MLSPGQRYKDVPTERSENLRYRRWINQRALANKRTRDGLVEACAADILFYINTFAFTFTPKAKGLAPKVVPFITYPFQDRSILNILAHIDHQRDLVIEKSRDMGASWMCLYAMEWLWHFVPWTQSLMVSRNFDLVDGNTPDALFWKIDFHHKWVPEWMWPGGSPGNVDRLEGYYNNRSNGATMTGQATTRKLGIGGRGTVLFLDEFSRVDRDIEVRDGTADTADCRIFNSTHTGPGTAFHGLATNGVTDRDVLHWTEHPVKRQGLYRYSPEMGRVEVLDKSFHFPDDFDFVTDGSPAGGPHPGLRSPWYDKECQRRGSSRAIATDLDIDVSGSQRLAFDPLIIRQLVAEYCCDPYWQGEIHYEKDTGKPIDLIPSPGGPLKLWCLLGPDGKPVPAPYVVSGDISAGTGATPSCLSITNRTTGEKVGEYTNPFIDPKELGYVAVALGWLFDDMDGEPARMIWEQQGPGLQFAGKVLALKYHNIFYNTSELPHTRVVKVSDRPGWVPNAESTDLLIKDYSAALKQRQFINRSEAAMKETLSFRYNIQGHIEHAEIASKNDPSGARVNHGDHVIADALGWKEIKDRWEIPGKAEEEAEIEVGTLAWRRLLHDNASRQREVW